MTENLPAVHETAYEGELVVGEDRTFPQIRDEHTDGWVAVIKPIGELAVQVAETEFVPKALRGKPEAVAAAILFGRELAMPPMQSLSQVHMIEGRPSVSAEHLRAMVLAAGHEIRFGEVSTSKCEIAGKRKGSDTWTWISWTLAMAPEKLRRKDNWQNYPRAMLVARASADLCRMIFADVTHGIRATEEVDDELDTAGTVAPAGDAAGKTTVGRARKSAAPKPSASPVGAAKMGALPGTSTSPLPPPTSAPVASEQARPATGSRPLAGEPASAEPQAEMQQCPHISNGVQCAFRVHEGKHSYELDEGPLDAEVVSEGDGSPDDVPATAAAGVPEKPKPMHTAQTKALQARFKGLGFTDEPNDRELRLLIASAIVGRTVDSFRAIGDNPMNYDEAQSIMTTLQECRTREDVIELMAKIAKGDKGDADNEA